MRRAPWSLVLCVLVLGVPAASVGIGDGAECNSSDGLADAWVGSGILEEPYAMHNWDRAAVCISAAGTTIFYVGGEGSPEDPDNRGLFDACGSGTLAGTSMGTGHPNQGNDPSDWDFDHVHPGPDGRLGTDDDVVHHHDCN